MSRDFSGTAEIILPVTATLRPSLPVTLAAWIRPDTISTGDGIYAAGKTSATHRGFWMAIANASGNIEASYGDNTGTTSSDRRSKVTSGAAAVSTGAWHHVACCIRGAGDMDIYLAGADAGGSYSGSGGAMAYDSTIAARIGTVANVFDGQIADVGLWSVTLSAAEVMSLSKGVSPSLVRPGSLIAHWPLFGIADPEIELSSNSLESATITGATGANHAPVGCPFPVAV